MPQNELKLATAKLFAETRKAGSGMWRICLATWQGNEPLIEFFREARKNWEEIPHEDEDQKSCMPSAVDF